MRTMMGALGLVCLVGSGCGYIDCPPGYEWDGMLFCVESGTATPDGQGDHTHEEIVFNENAAVGDMCFGDFDCASDQLCVVQDVGDEQGICTVTCTTWTDCTWNEIGLSFWDCVDIPNGTAVCVPDGF